LTETDVQSSIRLELSNCKCKIFRINVIASYTKDGRYVPPCVPNGFSDLFGVSPTGQAIFIEVKKPGHKTNKTHLQEQLNFLDQMRKSGAIAGMCESVEEAINLVFGEVTP